MNCDEQTLKQFIQLIESRPWKWTCCQVAFTVASVEQSGGPVTRGRVGRACVWTNCATALSVHAGGPTTPRLRVCVLEGKPCRRFKRAHDTGRACRLAGHARHAAASVCGWWWLSRTAGIEREETKRRKRGGGGVFSIWCSKSLLSHGIPFSQPPSFLEKGKRDLVELLFERNRTQNRKQVCTH